MSPLVVAAITIKFKSTFLHDCVISGELIFYNNFPIFGQTEISLSGQDYFKDIYIKFKKTELAEIS